jgi:hypothetical protein
MYVHTYLCIHTSLCMFSLTYVHTKFERIWLKTVVLRGLQKQRFCVRSSRASKDFR